MSQFTGFWSTVISSLKDGINENNFSSVVIGQVNPKNLIFPCAHIIPESSDYQSGHEYEDRLTVNFYFERNTDGGQDLVSNIEDVEDTIDGILDSLADNENVNEHKVLSINYLAGEVGKMIDVVSVSFYVTKSIEWGTR